MLIFSKLKFWKVICWMKKTGKEAVLINEAAAKAFGWDHPIGKKIHLNEKCIVKGVIKNIYYNAPIHPVTPAIFFSCRTTSKKK